jgi:hypothetical protein
MVSVYQRFDVPLEERIGEGKKHRFRKHNRTKKHEKKEAERRARRTRNGEIWRCNEWVGDTDNTPLGTFILEQTARLNWRAL